MFTPPPPIIRSNWEKHLPPKPDKQTCFAQGECPKSVVGTTRTASREANGCKIILSFFVFLIFIAFGSIPAKAQSFSIADVSVTEGSAATFTVTRSGATGTTVSVKWNTANDASGTDPAEANDYTAQTSKQTLSFGANDAIKTFTVATTNDAVDEGDETFLVQLSEASAGTSITDAEAVGTITDNDTKGVTVVPTSVTVTEAAGTTRTATYTVVLTSQPTGSVTVAVASDDTDAATVDESRLTFSISTWSTAQTVTVTGVDNQLDDGASRSATVEHTVSGADYAGVDASDVDVTVTDDDAAPTFSIADATVREGSAATFNVTRNGATGTTVSVKWNTANDASGTDPAEANDYTAQTSKQTLNFAIGDEIKTLSVQTTTDAVDEGNETFLVELSEATGATITDAEAVGTITDDDHAAIRVNDSSTFVGESLSRPHTVWLTSEPTDDVTVTITMTDVDENFLTVSPEEFTFTTQNWNIAQTVTVTPVDDDVFRSFPWRSFTYTAAGGGYDGKTHIVEVQIWDNDLWEWKTYPEASIQDESFGLRPASFETSLIYTLESRNENLATVSPSSFTVTRTGDSFAGDYPQEFTVTILDNDLVGDQTVELLGTFIRPSPTHPPNYRVFPPLLITITDNDRGVSLSANPNPVPEGSSVTVTATLTRALADTAGTIPVTIPVTIPAGTAESGDFGSLANITIARGQASGTGTISITNDAIDEINETFSVGLGTLPSQFQPGSPNSVEVTITDDDTKGVTVAPTSLTVTEAAGTTRTATYTVVLTSQPTGNVTVEVASDDTDAATVDESRLTFSTSTWSTAQTVTVTGVDNNVDDGASRSATVEHTVSGADYASVDASDVDVTVTDDDAAPTFSIADVSVTEGSAATFTVTRSGATGTTVSVKWNTANDASGTDPAEANDYTAVSTKQTLSFGVGVTSQTFNVQTTNDAVDEGDETFLVQLSEASGATITDAEAVGTITDDDTKGVTVDPTSLTVTEAAGTTRTATYTVVLTSQPTGSVTVAVESDDTDAATVDESTLTFSTSTWSTAQTVTVTGVDNNVDDGASRSATIEHTVSGADYASVDASDVDVTVTDDDAAPTFSIADVSVTEGSAATFTVTRSGATGTTVSVKWNTANDGDGDDPAEANDYTAQTTKQTLNFGVGITSLTFNVQTTADSVDEDDETFLVQLSEATGATITTATATGTITDNDTKGVTVDPTSLTVTEAAGNTRTATYTVVLTSQPTGNVTVEVASDDTDIATVDESRLTFSTSNWSTAQTVTVTGVDNNVDDGASRSATIEHTVSGADYASVDASDVDVTVTDDDAAPSFSIADVSVTEGSAATFTVTRSGATGTTVSVKWNTANDASGTDPAEANDYTAVSTKQTLSFGVGVTSQTFNVQTTNDAVDEGDETFLVQLSEASGATITDAEAVGTITDDDTKGVTVDPTSLTVTEAAGTTRTATYTVVLTSQPTGSVTVAVESDDTDAATVDESTLTFSTSTWSTAQTVTVTGVDNNVDDGASRSATIENEVSGADYASVEASDVTVTVTDDDTAPAFSIGDVSVTEGSAATFTVTRSGALGSVASVKWNTANDASGTDPAEANDYTAQTSKQTLSFGANDAIKTFTVATTNDAVDEGDETFLVQLSEATGATISDAEAVGTITDNDTKGVTVAPTSLTVTEAAGSTRTATYTVVLTSQPTGSVTVEVASDDTDAATVDESRLTFSTSTWSTAQTVTVTGVDNNVDDGASRSATIEHTVSGADYASVDASDVDVTVTDDDAAPTFSIADVSVTEGSAATFTVTRSGATGTTVSVKWNTANDGDGDDPAEANDYTAQTTKQTLNFGVGITSLTFNVQTTADSVDEDDETFLVQLSEATGATITTATATGTITDNDTKGVTVDPTSLTVTEAAGNTRTATYTVVLTSQPTGNVTVEVASDDTDIATVDESRLTFSTSNWSTAQTVTVTGVDNNVDDGASRSATIEHTVSGADYASVDASDVDVTVTDDDAAPSFSIADVSVTEGSAATFTVTRSGATGTTVSVKWNTANDASGTDPAEANDYTAVSTKQTLSFGVGVTSQTFNVQTTNDAVDEGDETFLVQLSEASGATITDAEAVGTITDDDTKGVTVDPTSLTVTEAAGTTRTATYTVVLTSQPTGSVTVAVESDDTDAATVDESTLTFSTSTWSTAQTVTVTGVDNNVDDGASRSATIENEVSGADYASVEASDVTVTVTDDDTAPAFSIGDVSVTEGSAATFTVTRSGALGSVASVKWNTANDASGTDPAEANDYTAQTSKQTLSFGANDAIKTFTVATTNDAVDEGDETFLVQLSEATGATISDAEAVGTITDNDTKGVTVAPTSLTVTEAAGSTRTATYTVVLTSQPTGSVTVEVASDDTDAATVDESRLTFSTSTWSTAQTVTVTGVDNNVDDGASRSATIEHTVSGADYASVDASDVDVTVTDDDAAPTFSIADVSVTEGSAATFTVTRSGATGTTVSVKWNTANDGDGDDPAEANDYTAQTTKQTLNFGVGITSLTFNVQTTADSVDEDDETFLVQLSEATGATITTATATGTITDNDTKGVTVDPTSLTVTEAAGNTRTATYTVVLTSQPTGNVTVEVASDDTDIATVDESRLTFSTSNWSTAQTVTVTGVDNNVDDGASRSATIDHEVSGADYASVEASDVDVTVTDDDAAPTFSIADVSVTEGSAATFTVTRSGATGTTVSVKWNTANDASGTDPAEANDYTAQTTKQTLNFAIGDAIKTFTVATTNDAVDEGDETFLVQLSEATGATISDAEAVGTITDNDTKGVTVAPTSLTVTEAAGSTRTATYTVVLTSQPTGSVTVAVESDDTDAATVDESTLTFSTSTWSTAQTVTVTGVDNNVDDGASRSATIEHTVSGADYASVDASDVDVTVTDDDAAPTFSIADVSVTEGSAATFTVTRSGATGTTVSVKWNTANDGDGDDPAEANDYTAQTTKQTLNFAIGDAIKTFTVATTNDAVDEGDETFLVQLSEATGATISDAEAVGTITDNDTKGVTVAPTSLTVTEAAGSTRTATYTVVLTSQPTGSVTVAVESDDTDAATVDESTLTFSTSTWSTAQTVTVTGVDNNVDDGASRSATIEHTVSGADYASVDASDVDVTVTDDDAAPTFSIADVSVTEGSAATFTVTRSGATGTTVSVKWNTANDGDGDDPAEANDYTAQTTKQTLNFGVGITSQTFNVQTTNDAVDEGDETFLVQLSEASGATITDAEAVGTITDDDTKGVTVDPTSLTVTEAAGTTRTATYTVVLTSQPTGSVTVAVESDDTDAATVDESTLTFSTSTWSTAQTVTVTGVDNNVDDGASRSATIEHTVSGADYASVDASDVDVTVTDDDAAPTFSIADVSVTEGSAATFTVTRSGATGTTVSVKWNTANDGDGDDPAEANDYTAQTTKQTLNFGVGITSLTFNVQTTADSVDEDDETFLVQLSEATGATITTATATGTITDNDTKGVTVDPTSLTVTEAAGNTRTATYTVVLTSQPTGNVTVEVASDDTDIATVDESRLTFSTSNWSTAQTVTVTGVDNNVDDGASRSATIEHTVSGADYASVDASDVDVTVTDDDAAPSFSIADVSVTEGSAATFTVTRSGATGTTVSVKWNTANDASGTDPAEANDYTAVSTKQTLSFGVGVTSQTFNVQTTNDAVDEGDETFLVQLSEASGATITDAEAVGTITDDDTKGVTVDPTSLTVTEAAGTTRTATYTVVLTSQPTGSVTVAVESDDTDAATVDESTLTFSTSTWSTAQTVTVTGVDNNVDDGASRSATIENEVSGADYASVEASDVTVTVTDDDTAPAFSIGDVSVTEGSAATFTVTRSGALGSVASVKWNTANDASGTDPAEANDYTAQTSKQTLSFGANDAIKTFTVATTNDAVDEGDETFLVQLSEATGATISDAEAVGTITDNDTKGVTVAPTSLTVTEAAGSTRTATYTVVLTSQPTGSVTVEVASDDTDAATVDESRLTFSTSTWSTAQTVTVTGVDNNVDDGASRSATIEHTVSGADYASVDASDVDVTVTDDDAAPTFSIADVSVTEGSAATFTVTRSGATGTTVSVKWNTANDGDGDDPAEANDYTAQTTKQTLNFGVGITSLTFNVQTTADSVDEDDETFLVQLSEATGATITTATATGTITDNDTKGVTVDPTSLTVTEAAGNTRTATYTVVLTSQPTGNVTVEVASDDTDIATVDESRLTFSTSNWSTAQTVTVTGVDNNVDDGASRSATIDHEVSGADYASVEASDVDVTVTDDDAAPTFSIADVSVTEGSAATFTVTRSGATGTTVSVKWNTANDASGTDPAEANDYTAQTTKQTLNFAIGDAIKTFTVATTNDAVDEGDETFLVQLSEATGATISDAEAVGTITDNDTKGVTVAPTSLTVTEAAGSTRTATYTVVLTSQPTGSVTVAVESDDTDAATVDESTLTFSTSTWSTAQTVTVTGVDNNVDDGASRSATIEHTVSGADYASVDASDVDVTVTDDDAAPTFSIADVSVTEGSAATFTVTRSGATGTTVSVKWNTANDGDGDDPAEANDYTAQTTKQTLNFAIGDAIKTFTVATTNDAVDEGDETFLVQLSEATGATISDAEAVGTITDNDTKGVTVAPTSLTVTEAAGSTRTATYTVVLTSQPTGSVTVAVESDDTDAATVDESTLTFSTSTWSTAQTVTVTGVDNNVDDGASRSATIEHTVSGADYASVDASDVDVTVTDDDAAPTFSIADVSVTEGSAATFTVTRSGATGTTVSVKWNTANDGDGDDPAEANDYTAQTTKQTLNFGVGITSQTFNVQTTNDAVDEGDETFLVQLSEASGATITDAEAVGTITDDDTKGVTVDPTSLTVTEAAGTTRTATYTVVLTSQPTGSVTVAVESDDTDAATVDESTLTFSTSTWSTAQTVTVTGVDNNVDDGASRSATIENEVSGADYASVEASDVTVTVTDDDTAPAFSIGDVSVTEGSAATFTVTRSGALGSVASVKWNTANDASGTDPAEANDYTAQTTKQTLNFAIGDAIKTFTVATTNDAVDEGDETFLVQLSEASGATITDAEAVGTITDDDTKGVTVDPTSLTVTEAAGTTRTATYTVVLTSQPTGSVTVAVESDDTDAATVDESTLTFSTSTWSTAQTVTVTGVDNNVDDGASRSATIENEVSGADYASVEASDVTVTVTDDDTAPAFSIGDVSVTEGSAATFTVTRSGALGSVASVKWNTANDASGTDPAEANDYTAQTSKQTLSFGANDAIKTFTVATTNDAVDEGDETFLVQLSEATGATISDAEAVGTITDNDTKGVTVAPTSLTVTEAAGSTRTATYTVVLTSQPTGSVTVEVESDDTDVATVDESRLTFSTSTWSTAQTVTVTGVDNQLDDGTSRSATIDHEVSGADYASVEASDVDVTVTDDDTAPAFSIGDVSVTEGSVATFTVTRSGALGSVASVKWNTANDASGTDPAEANDYTAQTSKQTLSFGANDAIKTFTVATTNDAVDEGDETFLVQLSEATGATISDAEAVGTITDNDTKGVTVAPTSLTVTEAAGSTRTATYTVVLTSQPTGSVTVEVASDDTDIATVDESRLTFSTSTWSTAQTVTVTGVDNQLDDGASRSATIEHAVSGADYAGVDASDVDVTVTDDDAEPSFTIIEPMPVVSIFPTSQIESVGTIVFSVQLSRTSQQIIKMFCMSVDETAVAGEDYEAEIDTLKISPNTMSEEIEMRLFDDDEVEGDETFKMVLSDLANAQFAGNAQKISTQATIIDDDEPDVMVSFYQSHYTISEGGKAVQIRVEISSGLEDRVELPLSVVHRNGATKADYSGVPEKIVFETWDDFKTFEVMAIDDDDDDDDEAVILDFDTPLPDGISTGGSTTIEIIDNDDPLVTVFYGKENYEIVEGGTKKLLSVHLSAAPLRRVEIPLLAVPANGATQADYSPIPERIIFMPNQIERTFVVSAIDDDDDDDGETVSLGFGPLPDRVNEGSLSTLHIIDNDNPEVTVSYGQENYEIIEGGNAVQVTVHLSADPERRVVIPLWMSLSSVSGATESDYTGVPEQIVFESGETVKTFTVRAKDDDEIEDDERVRMRFRSLPDGVNAGSLSTLHIIDNDNPVVTVSFDQSHYTATEGEDAVTITVSLSTDPKRRVEIPLLVTPENGATQADYTGVPEQIVFESGETVKTFALLATDDNVDDDGETITLRFGTLPDGVNNGGSTSVALVDNDDPVVTVSFDQSHYTATEGEDAVTITVSLSADPKRRVEIPLLVTPENGATQADYTGVPEQIVFESGETVKTFALLATDDNVDDDGETITLRFGTLPDGVNNGGSTSVALVDNDDPVVTVSFDQSHYTATEGEDAVTITVSLSADPKRRVEIPLLVTPENGATQADYTGVPEQIVFESGETVKTFALLATDDNVDDDGETITLRFGTLPDGVNNGGSTSVALVDNDDPVVTVSFDQSHYTATEGEDAVTITVSLSADPKRRVEIPLLVTPENGATQADYTGVPEQIVFESGETVKTFALLATDDNVDDDGETITLRFGTLPDGVNNGGSTSVALVDNDDPVVTVSFDQSHYTATEGEDAVTITVSLSADPKRRVEIPLLVTPENGATQADYTGVPEQIVFESGETVKTFALLATDDNVDDDGETITLRFGTLPDGVNNGGSTSVALVDNDDPVVTVSFDQSHYTATEGEDAVTITVSLSTDPKRRVEIPLLVTPENGATQADYTGVPEQIVFESGETVKTFALLATDDNVDDDGETITLRFGTLPDGVNNGGSASVALVDNDERGVAVSVAALAIAEESTGTYTVVLLSAPTAPVTLQISGMENTDLSVDMSQITFTAANWNIPQEVVVRAYADDDAIVDDGVTLHHAISGGDYDEVVVAPVAVAIIEKDVPVLRIEDQRVREDAGEMVFTATLNMQSSQEVHVSYATSNLTADAGKDYEATQGTLNFAALQTHQTFSVPIIDDDLDEGDETFTVILSTPMHVTISEGKARVFGTIEEDDTLPRAMGLFLSSVGRIVATQTVDNISRRFEDQRSGIRPSFTLGGHPLIQYDSTEKWHAVAALIHNFAAALGADIWIPSLTQGQGSAKAIETMPLLGESGQFDDMETLWDSPLRLRRVTPREVLSRSDFELSLNRSDNGSGWTLWGQGAENEISGQLNTARRIKTNSVSGYLGIDYRFRANTLVGLALTHSVGNFYYNKGANPPLVLSDYSLTSLVPYAHYQMNPKLGFWGLLGLGRGNVDVKHDEETFNTPLTLLMSAAGTRHDLATYRHIDLAIKTDAFFVTVASGAHASLPEMRENVERLRVLLEGRKRHEVGSSSQLIQSVEFGGRWDQGRVVSGAGVDIGGSVKYTHTRGLNLEARGRYLLVHEQARYKEWGASLSLRTDPGWGKRGLLLSVAPVWGVSSQSAGAMWNNTSNLGGGTAYRSSQAPGIRPDRTEVNLGYRFVRRTRGVLIEPYSGLSLDRQGWRRYHMGWRIELDERVNMNFEGDHSAQGQTAIRLRVHLIW